MKLADDSIDKALSDLNNGNLSFGNITIKKLVELNTVGVDAIKNDFDTKVYIFKKFTFLF